MAFKDFGHLPHPEHCSALQSQTRPHALPDRELVAPLSVAVRSDQLAKFSDWEGFGTQFYPEWMRDFGEAVLLPTLAGRVTRPLDQGVRQMFGTSQDPGRSLAQALELLIEALRIMDDDGTVAQIAAHLDLARAKLASHLGLG